MKRVALLLAACAAIAPGAAVAWTITSQIDYPNETHYVIKCDNGATATVKQMHPVEPKLAYTKGWWFVVGGSFFNYPSQDAAVKAACAAPKATK